MESITSLSRKIAALPRVPLAHLPTPLEEMMNLSSSLGNIRLFFKRDDQTGLAFGGNKSRKLEFIMADVLSQEKDTVITWAGVQSNWCRQTAAAAKKLGIQPILILFKRAGLPHEYDGNLLLDFMFDSDIRILDAEKNQKMMEYDGVRLVVDAVAEEAKEKGKRPYIAPIGGSMPEASMSRPWGAMGYVNAFIEIYEQSASQGIDVDAVVLATGSGATQAGLLVGAKILAPQTRTVGISVSETRGTMTRYVRRIADQALAELAPSRLLEDEDIVVFDDYLRGGYGILDREVTEALRTVAETEGILLDPVYTGKAMSGLIDLVQKGYFKKGANVVFLHSGGTPALFPYREKLLSFLDEE